ncbi:hypothetical protein LINPERPRIM_LOCUS28181 [Linum perenne]
MRSNH